MHALIPLFQVDAFSARPFSGNPAAVCLLDGPAESEWMQSVAAEMNLSETAFVVPHGDAFGLRWFTPAVEVPLCGHATLASAHILWESGAVDRAADIEFVTASGTLRASLADERIELDFPALATDPPEPLASELVAAIGATPLEARRVVDRENVLVELESEDAVRALDPAFDALRKARVGVIATARGDGAYDFVSRYFVPHAGIDEDPVTGSAHCALAPYWAEKLGKTDLSAYQASSRGGELEVCVRGDRVLLRGAAVTVMSGQLNA
jgi:PhzF family phenazine biosynthesis protein